MFAPGARAATGSSLVLRIAPEPGVLQEIATKRPGPGVRIGMHPMDLVFADIFEGGRPLSAYAALLDDAMRGDPTLFARADWVDLAWKLVDPLVEAWSAAPPVHFPNYEAGSDGPEEADELLARRPSPES